MDRAKTPTSAWYRWTSGPRGIYRTELEAREAWGRYNAACQRQHNASAQTMTGARARLYRCRTRQLARTIDVSTLRNGEEVVAHG